MHQNQPIGLTQLFSSEDGYITIGLTGVLSEYRGQHIALGLKVTSLEWVKTQGYFEVRTWNDSSNAPILALNQKLGFVCVPGYIECLKQFG
jgi:mycothiol synthase